MDRMCNYHSSSSVDLESVSSKKPCGAVYLSLLSLYPLDAQTIGFFYTLIGIFGMIVQFSFFPWVAKNFGVLNCTKLVYLIFPVLYLITPFTALVPKPIRNYCVFLLMLTKLTASIFGFPCCTILLTNSAPSLRVLGTLNGVGTSVSALGRGAGPALAGATFSFGLKRGFVIIPWWTLAVLAGLTAIPTFWIKETDGFKGHEDADEDEEDGDEEEAATGNGGGGGSYGAVSTNEPNRTSADRTNGFDCSAGRFSRAVQLLRQLIQ